MTGVKKLLPNVHADANTKAIFPRDCSGWLDLPDLVVVVVVVVDLAEGDEDGSRVGVLDGVPNDGADDLSKL